MQGLVKDFLLAVGAGETGLEEARQSLSNFAGYNPSGLFNVIDVDGDGNISAKEIVEFLESTGEKTIEANEVQVLIDFFDSDASGALNLTEFTHLILPCEDNTLREKVTDRKAGPIETDKNGKIPIDIENSLVKIIASEIALQRQLENIKRQLRGYSQLDIFHMVDHYQGEINCDNLDQFLKEAGHTASDNELLAIIRRMDADGDATITFTEWADFLREVQSLVKPEPLSHSLYSPSWRYRYGHLPYSSLSYYGLYGGSYYTPSWRHSYRSPSTYSHYWPSVYSAYRPYHRSALSSYLSYPAISYAPASYSYTAPRYTHTTYEPVSTYTSYVPRTYTSYAPVTTYSTRVVPAYKYVTERTEYVTTPVRTSYSTSAGSYYSRYGYGYSSPCHHRSWCC